MARLKTALLDTGPIVAYLNSRDPAHAFGTALLDDFSGRLHTTSAVVAEAMHLVGKGRQGCMRLAEFVAASGATVHDYTQPQRLLGAASLMAKYADTPMDFADATLVLLADGVRIYDVLTLDRRGFSTYRTESGEALRIAEA